jgi:branched-chain amino acid transport system ATP-binding protein
MSEAAPVAETQTAPLLEISGLSAFYGSAQALENVAFTMGRESVAIVGRNGMGKTTLCNAIMGISPPRADGSIRFQGDELVGVVSHKIARRGIGYVPQGRRLFPSLTVDQHLRIAARGAASGGGSEWTRDRVYELFPRLAQRRSNGGAQLSGGEQQMLAIGRALVTNPTILLMDEPSEGLAPLLVRELGRILVALKRDGVSILLVEQNLAFALRVADYVYLMSKGRMVHECTPEALKGDEAVKARYLGV